ncbi:MAG: hypothetical protein ACTHK8_21355 [Ginsengibacter sp.]
MCSKIMFNKQLAIFERLASPPTTNKEGYRLQSVKNLKSPDPLSQEYAITTYDTQEQRDSQLAIGNLQWRYTSAVVGVPANNKSLSPRWRRQKQL